MKVFPLVQGAAPASNPSSSMLPRRPHSRKRTNDTLDPENKNENPGRLVLPRPCRQSFGALPNDERMFRFGRVKAWKFIG